MLLPGLATFLLIGLVLINPFTEKLFYFNLAEGYVEGPWYKLMYYSAICHMAAAFIRIMDEFGIPHDWIQFEITETVATEYNGSLKKVADDFTAAGVRLCLDDFGSGYANLNTVMQLPFSSIKLDRSLLFDICSDEKRGSVLSERGGNLPEDELQDRGGGRRNGSGNETAEQLE